MSKPEATVNNITLEADKADKMSFEPEEIKQEEEEERKGQFNGFESQNREKDSYRNLQDLDSLIHDSGKITGEGHKATEARIKEFVEEKVRAKKPFTDTDFPPTRDSLYNTR